MVFSQNFHKVLNLLKKIRSEFGITIIMITHNHEVATLGDNILHLKDGILMELTDNVTA